MLVLCVVEQSRAVPDHVLRALWLGSILDLDRGVVWPVHRRSAKATTAPAFGRRQQRKHRREAHHSNNATHPASNPALPVPQARTLCARARSIIASRQDSFQCRVTKSSLLSPWRTVEQACDTHHHLSYFQGEIGALI